MKERKGTGTDGKNVRVDVLTRSETCRDFLHDAGSDALLAAVFGQPDLKLATEGVDFKPLWLVNESAERPKLRLVRD